MKLSFWNFLSLGFCVALTASAQTEPIPADEVKPAEEIESEAAQAAEKPTVSGVLQKIFGTEEEAQENEEAEFPETEESQAGIPEALTPEGDTGEPPDRYLPEEYKSASRKWQAPNYSGQTNALGWSSETFSAPEGLKKRVEFWKSIYSKYTTDQGVLHDSVYVDIVYTPIDFRPIMKDKTLSHRQQSKAREKLVNDKRKEIEATLRRLSTVTSATGLAGEDLRIWKLFEDIGEPNKFALAAQRNRVRFQLGQKDRFIVGIYYSGRYIHEMERIFREHGLPIELTRLPFVESSFNIFARSKVGASGIWQFMRRTARPYMMVNNNVDERNDPIEATRASAKMLRSNYQLLQSWPLAITAYNHGPTGVKKVVRKMGTSDITKIIGNYSSRTFGFASENFYACFLAALDIEKNAQTYFGDVKWSTEFEGQEIQVTRTIPYKALLSWFDGNEDTTRLQNFHIQTRVRKGRSEIPRGTFIRVPKAAKPSVLAYLQGSITTAGSSRAVRDDAKTLTKKPVVRAAESKRYRVRRGDNLSRISKNFGVTVSEIKRANNLRSDRLQLGQSLVIPD